MSNEHTITNARRKMSGSFVKLVPLLLTVAIVLSGCGSLVNAQNQCSAARQGYLSMWDCIRGAVAEGNAGMMNNAQGVRYLAVGDALAEQVRSGRMTDAQAKAQLAVELERDNAAYNAEQRANSPLFATR
jgi:hypothetical protein